MKKIFYSLVVALMFLVPLFTVQATGLSTSFGSNSNLNVAANSSGYKTTPDNNFLSIIASVISAVLAIVGSLFLILIIYGGITWMMAAGNEQKLEKASDTIRQALIGLIIVIAAYAISYYLVGMFQGKYI